MPGARGESFDERNRARAGNASGKFEVEIPKNREEIDLPAADLKRQNPYGGGSGSGPATGKNKEVMPMDRSMRHELIELSERLRTMCEELLLKEKTEVNPEAKDLLGDAYTACANAAGKVLAAVEIGDEAPQPLQRRPRKQDPSVKAEGPADDAGS